MPFVLYTTERRLAKRVKMGAGLAILSQSICILDMVVVQEDSCRERRIDADLIVARSSCARRAAAVGAPI